MWENFLFEEKICTRKMIIHTTDQHCAATWNDVYNLPAFEPVIFERGHIKTFIERVII
jgi:hypothetical protein